MARSEFRYNRRGKHYSYLFKDVGSKKRISFCFLNQLGKNIKGLRGI